MVCVDVQSEQGSDIFKEIIGRARLLTHVKTYQFPQANFGGHSEAFKVPVFEVSLMCDKVFFICLGDM